MTRTPANPRDNVEPFGHLADERLVDLALDEATDAAEREHLRPCARVPGRPRVAAPHRRRGARGLGRRAGLPGRELWSRIVSDIDAPESGQRDARSTRCPPRSSRWRRPTSRSSRRRTSPRALPRSSYPCVAAEATRVAGSARPVAAGPRSAWLAAACAAGVLLGAGGFVAADRLADDPDADRGARTVATAELDTLDTGQWLGSGHGERAGRRRRRSRSSVASSKPADGGYVEVWLINRDGKRHGVGRRPRRGRAEPGRSRSRAGCSTRATSSSTCRASSSTTSRSTPATASCAVR